MAKDKKYFIYLDILRVLACLAVLLYHFGLLAGGFLAVCTFFVLSGYLAVYSASKKEKFSILEYYKNRITKIYLPLLVVVFVSLSVTSFLPDVNWISMKPETTSVIAGYNNFWQLKANQDYFARHISSPYIHLWYIAILLQFELVFPFIFILLKKIENKTSKKVPIIISLVLAIVSTVYFYISIKTQNIMSVYYNTFIRMFSIIFGIALGFIHTNYKVLIPKKIQENSVLNKGVFFAYASLVTALCICIDSTSPLFAISMIITTLISCRMIDYAILKTSEIGVTGKVIKSLASISYEIYLFQYPVIFVFQNIQIKNGIKIPLMVVLILVLSYFMHFCTSFKDKNKKEKILRILCSLLLSIVTLHGIYCYITAKDHTKEMKLLEEQLAQNEEMMQRRQEEIEKNNKEQEQTYQNEIKQLENTEEELKESIPYLNIVGVGDSVMLGAIMSLYEKFPNAYIDAATSRSAMVAKEIIESISYRGMLGDPIVINLGANGDCSKQSKIDLINICKDRKIFWINILNDNEIHINDELNELAQEYENFYVIDWVSASDGHPEYFIADGIHLTGIGMDAYADAIYNAIYDTYVSKYTKQKEELITKHEEVEKNRITFYGNDVLTNVYDNIKEHYEGINFVTNKEYNLTSLKEDIKAAKENNTLTNRIVFVLDKTSIESKEEYEELISFCEGHDVYIVKLEPIEIEKKENVTIIDFSGELQNNESYLLADKIHLSNEGNEALAKLIIENVK